MKEKISTVMGRFGRLSAGAFCRPVNSHTYKEPGILFHLGGAECVVNIDERPIQFKAGDMLLLNPWTPHSRTAAFDQPSTLITLLIEPSLLDADATAGSETAFRFLQTTATIDSDVRLQLERLVELMFDRPMAQLETIQQRIEQLIDVVCTRYAGDGRSAGEISVVDFRVRRAFESLRSSAMQGIKIEALAAGSGMSRSHFFRQFKRCIGVSPQHVIDEERVAYALRALSASDIMLSTLSEELGFSAPAHFTRFFVQHLGCTPSQFRRNLLVV